MPVERVAAWINRQGSLLLNDDGRLWERPVGHGAHYRLVSRYAGILEATEYADKRGYEIIGLSDPRPFLPTPDEREPMPDATTSSVSESYYDAVTALIEGGEAETQKDAIDLAAKRLGKTRAAVQNGYYKIKSRREGGNGSTHAAPAAKPPRPATTGRWQGKPDAPVTVRRGKTPEELVNILPMLRAGIAAFERIITWAEDREAELTAEYEDRLAAIAKREAEIGSKETEIRERLRAEIDRMLGSNVMG